MTDCRRSSISEDGSDASKVPIDLANLKKWYCLFVPIRVYSCRVRVWCVSCSCLIPQTRIKICVVFVFANFVSCKFVSDKNTRYADTDCQHFTKDHFKRLHSIYLYDLCNKSYALSSVPGIHDKQ
ncbi:hypothetical protein LXL04_011087 [Taraxacum kok-saghyz]